MQGCLWLVEIHSPSFQGALKRALEPVRTLLQGHGGGLEFYRDNGKDNGNTTLYWGYIEICGCIWGD